MKTHYSALALLVLAFFTGCASLPPDPSDIVTRSGATVLIKDARATRQKVIVSHNAKGKPVELGTRIPQELWVGSIRELEPKYVYLYGANVVVVTTTREDEKGLLIAFSISSSIPRNVDGFTLSQEPIARALPYGEIFTFIRTR